MVNSNNVGRPRGKYLSTGPSSYGTRTSNGLRSPESQGRTLDFHLLVESHVVGWDIKILNRY